MLKFPQHKPTTDCHDDSLSQKNLTNVCVLEMHFRGHLLIWISGCATLTAVCFERILPCRRCNSALFRTSSHVVAVTARQLLYNCIGFAWATTIQLHECGTAGRTWYTLCPLLQRQHPHYSMAISGSFLLNLRRNYSI